MKLKTTTLILSAIIAALPFGAMADWISVDTPAQVPEGDDIVEASTNGPYVTVSIDNDDEEHIATTAYVKGAYNDTIAAINAIQDWVYNIDDANAGMQEVLNAKRVPVYTTWDNDSATTPVSLITVWN